MAAKFEHIKGYEDVPLPVRATTGAAGYDFVAAEDIIVPAFSRMQDDAATYYLNYSECEAPLTLEETADIIKKSKGKITLVPTGVKCRLDPGTYLELSVRSSLPLKHWLILANSSGKVDSDYYGSAESDGHIFFQLINLAPWDIIINKGDRIGQGIITPYQLAENDNCTGAERAGGFGSTSEPQTADNNSTGKPYKNLNFTTCNNNKTSFHDIINSWNNMFPLKASGLIKGIEQTKHEQILALGYTFPLTKEDIDKLIETGVSLEGIAKEDLADDKVLDYIIYKQVCEGLKAAMQPYSKPMSFIDFFDYTRGPKVI